MLLKQTKIKDLQCNKYCLQKKLKDFRFLSTALGAIIKCKVRWNDSDVIFEPKPYTCRNRR